METAEKVYFVGKKREYTSLSGLCLQLKDDTEQKTIYLDEGVYDIYWEYRQLGVEAPPDDISNSDYLTRVIFLPPCTRLVGVGDVTLLWDPPKDEITVGEARVWAPLNIRYGCCVENIAIRCHYGRYCIHDDSHNAPEDQGTDHVYRNVRCFYTYSEDRKGFNNTIGFGFSQKSRIRFENCTFRMLDVPEGAKCSAFYGHAASGRKLIEEEGPEIIVENCTIDGGQDNYRCAKLQCLNRVPLHVKTVFRNTVIAGGLYLNLYTEDALHAFDVLLENCGNPPVTADRAESNPYPVRIRG